MQKIRRRELQLSSAYKKWGLFALPKNRNMIQFIEVILKEIFEQGRKFSWKRPSKCPKCSSVRVWGHGFVPALFDGFDVPLFLKRYRCPDCGCVITMRPKSHFSRFQSSRDTIRSSLQNRIVHGRWPLDLTSARMRHWLTNLKRQITAYIPQHMKIGLMDAYDCLLGMGKVPVSRSI